MSDQCIEPGCSARGVVGVNGKWVCLDHFDKYLASLKDALRATALRTIRRVQTGARRGDG